MTCPGLTTVTAYLSLQACQMGLLSLSGNSTLRHNSGTDVAVDRLALDTELPLQRAHCCWLLSPPGAVVQNSFNQNFKSFNFKKISSDHKNEIKSPPKLKTLIIFNTKINQITVITLPHTQVHVCWPYVSMPRTGHWPLMSAPRF